MEDKFVMISDEMVGDSNEDSDSESQLGPSTSDKHKRIVKKVCQ
jgi:hypothetical protein